MAYYEHFQNIQYKAALRRFQKGKTVYAVYIDGTRELMIDIEMLYTCYIYHTDFGYYREY